PPHADASAYYAASLLRSVGSRPSSRIAILASILAHHGGWWPKAPSLLPLVSCYSQDLDAIGITPARLVLPPPPHAVRRSYKEEIDPLLLDGFETIWPKAAYVTRIVRLSDQPPTEEANSDG